MRWHQMWGEVVVETLRTSRRGLKVGEARRRLEMVPTHDQPQGNPGAPSKASTCPSRT